MNDKDRERMAAYGITCVPKNVYHFREFKYDRLEDALRYAEIEAGREQKADPDA